ncbi:MAG: FAD-dependent thymidylate synthase [Proteobacteria bacterium]|jgi:thymidylate synthase (FAD)|nr:FAD-dependent thymidylate synthase [Pseudomonadota bacterium]
MILIKPSSKVLAVSVFSLNLIELAGRVCYKSEDKITKESNLKFAEKIINLGHESVLEHASATVRIICDRGVSHEIVRHRLASYSQESTRYCDYNKSQVTFVIPPWVSIEPGEYLVATNEWMHAMISAEDAYKALRLQGWKPEQARSVLPNSLKTELVMTANFREWRHVFKLRTSDRAHPQMREIMCPLLEQFRQLIPVIFDENI